MRCVIRNGRFDMAGVLVIFVTPSDVQLVSSFIGPSCLICSRLIIPAVTSCSPLSALRLLLFPLLVHLLFFLPVILILLTLVYLFLWFRACVPQFPSGRSANMKSLLPSLLTTPITGRKKRKEMMTKLVLPRVEFAGEGS